MSQSPFAKTGAHRAGPKANIAKPVDRAADMRADKIASLTVAAASVNESTLEHLKAASALKEGSPAIKAMMSSSRISRATTTASGRHRPAIPPAAKASDNIPRYFETTERAAFRSYSLDEMMHAMPWCVPAVRGQRGACGRAREETRMRAARPLRPLPCAARLPDARFPPPCLSVAISRPGRKDKRDGKGDRHDENELREKWHPGEKDWDYTANNAKVEKIDFIHGDKWGLNAMSAGGARGF
jgi:hypothetical protein